MWHICPVAKTILDTVHSPQSLIHFHTPPLYLLPIISLIMAQPTPTLDDVFNVVQRIGENQNAVLESVQANSDWMMSMTEKIVNLQDDFMEHKRSIAQQIGDMRNDLNQQMHELLDRQRQT